MLLIFKMMKNNACKVFFTMYYGEVRKVTRQFNIHSADIFRPYLCC